MKNLFAVCAVLTTVIGVAEADTGRRSQEMTSLARIFGEMHHIRRLCAPESEADVWRNRMKRMVALEQPSTDVRQSLVGAFNGGYASAEGRFFDCEDAAEDYAALRAAEGEAIVLRLMAPLVQGSSE